MPDISLETDSAAAAAAKWREHAEQVERHGQHHHVPPEALPALLGDVYGPYIDAVVGDEYQARAAAYARVAAKARGHAEKLDNTRARFTAADEDAAQRFAALGS